MVARVLLADESATVQKAVSLMLADEGIEVVAVSDGRQAVALLDRGAVDLVIAGLSLPEIGGQELCRYIKSSPSLRRVPVILLVGAFDPLDQRGARRIGADAQLAKPPESRPLIQTVRNLLEKDRALRPPSPLPFATEHSLSSRDAADEEIERSRPQSIFFKPYIPPPDLTVEQLSFERRALPARMQPDRLGRKPRRLPGGASVILITTFAFLVAAALALWLFTRPGNAVPDASTIARQSSSVEPASDQPGPSDEGTGGGPGGLTTEGGATEGGAGESINELQPPAAALSRRWRDSTGSKNYGAAAVPAVVREQMLARARMYEDRGMLAQAELQYRAVLHKFPGDPTSRFGVKRLEARISAERREQNLRASREAGLRAFRYGDYAQAVAGLTLALNGGRGDTAVLYSLGASQWKLGRAREAQASFERCLVTNPNYAPAIVGLAQVKAAEGKQAEAVALLNRALELGGGAEFSRERIREMIARYTPHSSSSP